MPGGRSPRQRDVPDTVLDEGELGQYQLAHAARAALLRRLGRQAEARVAYQRAMELTHQVPEQRYLARQLAELDDEPAGSS